MKEISMTTFVVEISNEWAEPWINFDDNLIAVISIKRSELLSCILSVILWLNMGK